jgi:hypothetical protein
LIEKIIIEIIAKIIVNGLQIRNRPITKEAIK